MLTGGHSTGEESPRTETVSVVMATFNGAEFLDEQLESLVTQTQLPDELVVVDDASTDGTQNLLRAFARRAPFPVQIVEQPYHVGTSPNFEEGIVRSTGDLIAIADQDDRWRPDKIAVMANRMAREPDVLMAFSDAVLIDAAHDAHPCARAAGHATIAPYPVLPAVGAYRPFRYGEVQLLDDDARTDAPARPFEQHQRHHT